MASSREVEEWLGEVVEEDGRPIDQLSVPKSNTNQSCRIKR